jgi:four helix bundle protein
MSVHGEAKLDQKFVEFARLMNTYLNHFPKHEKYGLAQQIRQSAYAMYGFIVEAQKRYSKKTTLTNLDIQHEQTRMFLRLAYELGYFGYKTGVESDEQTLATHRYLAISRIIDEMGRMIGGWIAMNHQVLREAS